MPIYLYIYLGRLRVWVGVSTQRIHSQYFIILIYTSSYHFLYLEFLSMLQQDLNAGVYFSRHYFLFILVYLYACIMDQLKSNNLINTDNSFSLLFYHYFKK